MNEEPEDTGAATVAAVVIPDHIAKLVDWIPRRRYLELYGETGAAVTMRIAKNHWRQGVEYNVPKGGGLWISIKAVNDWAKT